jgi:NADH-quinone oxidoreductase subunit N
MISAGLSIIIGTFGALNQIKLKRLMAYSAISHMGFIFIGLSLASIYILSSK